MSKAKKRRLNEVFGRWCCRIIKAFSRRRNCPVSPEAARNKELAKRQGPACDVVLCKLEGMVAWGAGPGDVNVAMFGWENPRMKTYDSVFSACI
jgi:hypothetical protein